MHDASVTQYVWRLTTSSAQTIYALRVLQTHGLTNAALQQVYRSTVVVRLTYAASAWRDLTKASDRQLINSVIDRARRQGYCSPDLLTFDELCDVEDNKLFDKSIRHLPSRSTASQCYSLRQRRRRHSLRLPKHSTHTRLQLFYTHAIQRHIIGL